MSSRVSTSACEWSAANFSIWSRCIGTLMNRSPSRPAKHGADAGEQLLVGERTHEEVVAPALERTHAIDGIRLRLSEDDHRHVAVARTAFVQRGGVAEQDEIGPRLAVDDLEAVAAQVALEEAARAGLRFGEQERVRHADERSGTRCGGLDVLSRKSVTNDLQSAAPDDAPEQPHPEQSREREAEHGDDVDAEHVGAGLGKDADQARADQPAGDDHRDDEAVEDNVEPVEQVVQALLDETRL